MSTFSLSAQIATNRATVNEHHLQVPQSSRVALGSPRRTRLGQPALNIRR